MASPHPGAGATSIPAYNQVWAMAGMVTCRLRAVKPTTRIWTPHPYPRRAVLDSLSSGYGLLPGRQRDTVQVVGKVAPQLSIVRLAQAPEHPLNHLCVERDTGVAIGVVRVEQATAALVETVGDVGRQALQQVGRQHDP